jgi:hypothetical protein
VLGVGQVHEMTFGTVQIHLVFPPSIKPLQFP